MSKTLFRTIRSTVVPLPNENIDTDQIIPARFLKATVRTGFGENLFRDWRYDAEGKPRKDFVLNDPQYGGSILVAGRNFGSGSSREHAAWALADYGFKVVVSSFFGDIFRNNSLNNQILPVQVTEPFLQEIFQAVKSNPKTELEVNLEEQYLKILPAGSPQSFDINPYKKSCLINGFDDLDYLLTLRGEVERFEAERV